MFKNYLKIAFRNIRKHFVFSFINIFGLTLGIAGALLIFSFVEYELSVDSFHQKVDSIYQVFVHRNYRNNITTPLGLGPALKEEMPEITSVTRYHWPWGENYLTYGQVTHMEPGIRFVDPSFWSIFNFPLMKGDPASALKDPNSAVISSETARKYFGDQNPMGKVLLFNHRHPLKVTGVLEPMPSNSSLKFDLLVPIEFNIRLKDKWYLDWQNLFAYTFIKCRPNTSPGHLSTKTAALLNHRRGTDDAWAMLMPLKERYFFLYSDRTVIYAFSTIAIFILLIACFNFMNLSTARSTLRAREVGMRKVAGARKKQMVGQFLGESILIAFVAAGLAIITYILLFPLLKQLTGREILMSYSPLVWYALILAAFTGLASGIYPAFFLSSFKITQVVKGKLGAGMRGRKLRKGMVTLQFILSIMLVIGMLVVRRQTTYIQETDIGYNKKNLVCVPMGGGSEKYYKVFKNALLTDSRILSVSGTGLELPIFNWRQGGWNWEGKDPEMKIQTSYNAVDYGFISTMGMTLLQGEDFTKGKSPPRTYIVNEEMAGLLGNDRVVNFTLRKGKEAGKIIGVVKNFHFNSMRNSIEPLVLELVPQSVDNLLIRIKESSDQSGTLEFVRQTWEKLLPQYPFRSSFLEDDYLASTMNLRRTGDLLSVFSILAIIISCLGLFGLSSYSAVRKTKEIGVRKVLGASYLNIVKNISLEFIYLVLLSNLLVWPVAYYSMSRWLQKFAYHTELSLGIFILAGLATLIIALLTIGYQTLKAARANPVETLRYE